VDGARHDVYCLDESAALHALDPDDWTSDKGYVGRGIVSPIKKTTYRDMLDWEHEFNKGINSVRATVERVIAHPRTGRSSTAISWAAGTPISSPERRPAAKASRSARSTSRSKRSSDAHSTWAQLKLVTPGCG
jgi:DDE superfamily endonuclease